MKLNEIKLNALAIVKNMDLPELDKLRLMELGLNINTKIVVKRKSIGKRNLLVNFNNSCFTIGSDFAKNIEVEYA